MRGQIARRDDNDKDNQIQFVDALEHRIAHTERDNMNTFLVVSGACFPSVNMYLTERPTTTSTSRDKHLIKIEGQYPH